MLKKLYWFLFIYDLDKPLGNTPYAGEGPWKKKLARDVGYLLLLSYSLFIFNSITPVFTDAVAHTFWEKEHLLTVHKENGKTHVHYQILNAEKQSSKDKSSSNGKTGSEEFIHLLFNTAYTFVDYHFTIRPYYPYKFNYTFSYVDIYYRPPVV